MQANESVHTEHYRTSHPSQTPHLVGLPSDGGDSRPPADRVAALSVSQYNPPIDI